MQRLRSNHTRCQMVTAYFYWSFYAIGYAGDVERYPKFYKKIAKSAKGAEKALKVFRAAIIEARLNLNSITNSQTFWDTDSLKFVTYLM